MSALTMQTVSSEQYQLQATIHGFPESMVLLDVETTGGKATRDRITEIALMVVENGKLLKTWQSFVNPQTPIPPWIQKLTGIRNEMVKEAPTFEEIAPVIQGVCEGRILVAHNARFDYGFLKNEFKRLGQSFQVKTLCSVKMSRAFFPQHKRHGLDQIIRRLRLRVENRHRALDDTQVIWRLMVEIDQQFSESDIKAVCQNLLQRPAIPAHLDAQQIQDLPNRPGVYRFWQEDKLLYVGKSVTIRDRVMSHFTQDHAVAKDLQMSGKITEVDCQETPSDFGAQLLENEWVKAQRPQHNVRLKKLTKLYQVTLKEDAFGYLGGELRVAQQHEVLNSENSEDSVFGLFRSRRQAQQWMEKAVQRHQLCAKVMGLEGERDGKKPCFALQLKKCLGACCQKEPAASYNLRMQQAFSALKQQVWPWPEPIVVIERSVHDTEFMHFHLIDQWRYLQRFTTVQAIIDWMEDLGEKPSFDDAASDFDLDAYLILIRFLLKPPLAKELQVVPMSELASAVHRDV